MKIRSLYDPSVHHSIDLCRRDGLDFIVGQNPGHMGSFSCEEHIKAAAKSAKDAAVAASRALSGGNGDGTGQEGAGASPPQHKGKFMGFYANFPYGFMLVADIMVFLTLDSAKCCNTRSDTSAF